MKKEDNLECTDPGISRRSFLKYGASGMAALVVGTRIPWLMENEAYGAVQVQTLNFHITDAMKDMVTHNVINDAHCYFWIFKEDRFPAECPGPNIFTTTGDFVVINLTNDLDEDHAFLHPRHRQQRSHRPGRHQDHPLHGPQGRHLSLLRQPEHTGEPGDGAPRRLHRHAQGAAPGHKFTPYNDPDAQVQRLFDDLGTTPWPGLSWEAGRSAHRYPGLPPEYLAAAPGQPQSVRGGGDSLAGREFSGGALRATPFCTILSVRTRT